MSLWFSGRKFVSILRSIIAHVASILGASRVRQLPPEQFCKHGFVMGKSSEAGFGNEMYKILTAGALSIMLNRSLIIGQTRHVAYIKSFYFYLNIGFEFNNCIELLEASSVCDSTYFSVTF